MSTSGMSADDAAKTAPDVRCLPSDSAPKRLHRGMISAEMAAGMLERGMSISSSGFVAGWFRQR